MKLFFYFALVLSSLLNKPSRETEIHPDSPQGTDTLRTIEKVYLHTDRTYYYPGDDIWFKAYLVDGSSHLLSDRSSNLHIELISASEIISQRVIKLTGGLGNGDFRLPENLSPGRYRIRAYTNYMRNYGDQLFFNKEILVINSNETTDSPTDNLKYVQNKIAVSFFPEGGTMVDNVSSVVAFKATDSGGKGYDASGDIYASTGELVTSFKSSHLGMGSFILKPIPGKKYYAVVKGPDGDELKYYIPESMPLGISLEVTMNSSNKLSITVKTNAQTLPLLLGHYLMLTISARNEILKTLSFKIKSFTNSFDLPADDLPDGIAMLTLATAEDLPLSERLVFIQPRNDVRINIEPEKLNYNKRDGVTVKISLKGDSTGHTGGHVSLSVTEKNLAGKLTSFPGTISSWFLLESDVRGFVENPSCYFDPSNLNRVEDLDLLLRTQGWRDFAWKYDKMYFPQEAGFTISGRLRQYYLNRTPKAPKINIGIFEGKNTYVSRLPVDTSGSFMLNGIDITGEARVVISAVGRNDHLRGLLILDSVKYQPPEISEYILPLIMVQKEELVALKQEFEIIAAIKRKYKLSDTIGLGEVRIISHKPKSFQDQKIEASRAMYGTPDNELIITPQMESFNNPVEMIRGRFAGVQIKGNKIHGYEILIRGTHSFNAARLPLVLIDGFKKDFDYFLNFPIQFIDRVDIIKSAGATGAFGMEGTNGVIAIITRTGDRTDKYEPVSYSANLRMNGYNAARIFYSPRYDTTTASSYNPDLRTTLLWNPEIKLDDDRVEIIKYYNSDISSIIRIAAEGITTTGIPVTGSAEYEVR